MVAHAVLRVLISLAHEGNHNSSAGHPVRNSVVSNYDVGGYSAEMFLSAAYPRAMLS